MGFLRADFRPYIVIDLDKPQRILFGQCRVWTKIRSEKTAKHIPVRNVCGILVAEDAALLTQGKDDKAKRAKQSRWNAAGVRLPLDLV